jgi:hypothetical protein
MILLQQSSNRASRSTDAGRGSLSEGVMTFDHRKATKYAASLTPEQHLSTGSQLQPPLLVPVREAARLLSISAWEIRRLCRKGALNYKKLGRTKWLVVSGSIAAFAGEVER